MWAAQSPLGIGQDINQINKINEILSFGVRQHRTDLDEGLLPPLYSSPMQGDILPLWSTDVERPVFYGFVWYPLKAIKASDHQYHNSGYQIPQINEERWEEMLLFCLLNILPVSLAWVPKYCKRENFFLPNFFLQTTGNFLCTIFTLLFL